MRRLVDGNRLELMGVKRRALRVTVDKGCAQRHQEVRNCASLRTPDTKCYVQTHMQAFMRISQSGSYANSNPSTQACIICDIRTFEIWERVACCSEEQRLALSHHAYFVEEVKDLLAWLQ